MHYNLLITSQLGPSQSHRNRCKTKGSVLQEVLHRTFQGLRGVLCLVRSQWESISWPVYASFVALVRITCLHLPWQVRISFLIIVSKSLEILKEEDAAHLFPLNFLENKTCTIKSRSLPPLASSLLIRRKL